ncbi:MAG: hypothetical protein RMI89_04730 [Gloeomargarita sp. SKYBB_i_bin120]|nr:hypothetical protein [Gloeomargarita sp. SKYG98]MCS7292266.1 hypothetical protein [Gloeomargarita sp. SKYB120]MDW8177827.1 hypothetical protein [Gloeomargarita sp. SKYBB_i_bin120]
MTARNSLPLAAGSGSLTLVSIVVTLSLLAGMVLVLSLAVSLIIDSSYLGLGLLASDSPVIVMVKIGGS